MTIEDTNLQNVKTCRACKKMARLWIHIKMLATLYVYHTQYYQFKLSCVIKLGKVKDGVPLFKRHQRFVGKNVPEWTGSSKQLRPLLGNYQRYIYLPTYTKYILTYNLSQCILFKYDFKYFVTCSTPSPWFIRFSLVCFFTRAYFQKLTFTW